jgi:hypothetical protein
MFLLISKNEAQWLPTGFSRRPHICVYPVESLVSALAAHDHICVPVESLVSALAAQELMLGISRDLGLKIQFCSNFCTLYPLCVMPCQEMHLYGLEDLQIAHQNTF